ncbi:MAG TPA: DUF523 domain-containing protein [Geobacteraceae bacterium]
MGGSIAVGVSACLLGEKVRYDGGHKHDLYITNTLGKIFRFVPVCPEAECGMGIPRAPMRLEGDPANPRLLAIEGQVDMTGQMLSYCRAKMAELEVRDLCGFICKARSPSCGLSVDVYDNELPAGKGKGLFAGALLEHFPLLPVVEESGLDDPEKRADFIARVLAYHRANR